MIVLDSSVLISFLEAGHPHAEAALGIMDTEEELVLHPLAVAECAVGAIRNGMEGEFRATLSRVGIVTWHPDDEHSYRVARLRAAGKLKLPDCCMLDAASHLGADLATFDQALAEAADTHGVNPLTLSHSRE
jgi:predicted nucleic acid-binding protein